MGDVVAGLLTGLSLIVAIGAQNAFVLRQGLRRSHVGLVVAICALSDVVLIVAGVAGIGALVERAPWALDGGPLARRRVPHRLRRGLAAARPTRRRPSTRGDGVVEARRGVAGPRGRPHLAQPARLPRHRAAARVDRRDPRHARALVVRARRVRGEHRVVRRPRVRRPAGRPAPGQPARLAGARRAGRPGDAGDRRTPRARRPDRRTPPGGWSPAEVQESCGARVMSAASRATASSWRAWSRSRTSDGS